MREKQKGQSSITWIFCCNFFYYYYILCRMKSISLILIVRVSACVSIIINSFVAFQKQLGHNVAGVGAVSHLPPQVQVVSVAAGRYTHARTHTRTHTRMHARTHTHTRQPRGYVGLVIFTCFIAQRAHSKYSDLSIAGSCFLPMRLCLQRSGDSEPQQYCAWARPCCMSVNEDGECCMRSP